MKKRVIADAVSADVGSGLDRFDLEQQILNCWNIIDDIKAVTENGVSSSEGLNEYMNALTTMYNVKFNKLFDTFGILIEEGKIV
jgi:hypothetical protein